MGYLLPQDDRPKAYPRSGSSTEHPVLTMFNILSTQKDCELHVIATSVHFIRESERIGLINHQAAAKMSEPNLNFAFNTGTRHQNCQKKRKKEKRTDKRN